MKNKNTAGILAILLGAVGVHKFYLGKTGQGVLYIFLFMGLFGILGIIDGVKILTMDQKKFDAEYNGGKSDVSSGISVADELSKLHELKEKGIITQSEFEAKKRQIF